MSSKVFSDKTKHERRESNSVPLDATLPALSVLERPPQLADILSSLLTDRLGAKRRISECGVKVRRYVPGKRCVVVFDLTIEAKESDAVQDWTLIGKIYANGHGQKVFETLQELWRHGFADGQLTVSEPLAYDPHWQLLLLDHSKGELLRNLILTRSDLGGTLEGAAEWLAKLHGCGVSDGRRYTLRDHLRMLRARESALEQASPSAARRFGEILTGIESFAVEAEEGSAGPTHRDFSPDHLLVEKNRFTGLDFDEFCQYEPLFDVAHFMAHVRYLGLLHSSSLHHFDSLAARFWAAYQSCSRNRSFARLELNLALAYLKLAQIVGLVTRPANWREMMDVLLAEAEQFCEAR